MNIKVQRFKIIFSKLSIVMICCLCLLLSFPTFAISEEKLEIVLKEGESKVHNLTSASEWTALFKDQIEQWVSDISKQDARFQNWTTAKWESYPFGPGSKQWMILLIKDKQEIGYLIIGVDSSDQFILIEYGQSQQGILSETVQDQTDHFFYSGLLLAYKREGVLVDAITKERYEHVAIEEVEPVWNGQAVLSIQQVFDYSGKVHEENPIVHYTAINDGDNSSNQNNIPTEKKVDHHKEIINEQVQKIKKNQPVFYQAEILPQVRGLYEVVTIHQWVSLNQDHEPTETYYFGFNDGGVRFFSFEYLSRINGTFY